MEDQALRISRKAPNMGLDLLVFCHLTVPGEETAWSWSSSTHDTSKGAKQAVGRAGWAILEANRVIHKLSTDVSLLVDP